MTSAECSPIVLEVLLAGGWFEGRHVPIDEAVNHLQSQGFAVSQAVQEVLHEFYPLDFAPHPDIAGSEGIKLDPRLLWDDERIDYLNRIVADDCCLFATKGVGDFFMMPSGRIVMLDIDWSFIQFAKDLTECFEAHFCAKHSTLATTWLTEDQIPYYMRRNPPK